MGKTNHRINKDRAEKLSEAAAHKQRRGAKQQVDRLVGAYVEYDDPDELYDDMEDEEIETFVKIRRKR